MVNADAVADADVAEVPELAQEQVLRAVVQVVAVVAQATQAVAVAQVVVVAVRVAVAAGQVAQAHAQVAVAAGRAQQNTKLDQNITIDIKIIKAPYLGL